MEEAYTYPQVQKHKDLLLYNENTMSNVKYQARIIVLDHIMTGRVIHQPSKIYRLVEILPLFTVFDECALTITWIDILCPIK